MTTAEAGGPPESSSTDRTTVRPETKRRYLEAATDLAQRQLSTEPAFAHVVGHVRLSAVAARLGVSRSSLYRFWPTQHDFWRDLVMFMSTRDDEPWMYDEVDSSGEDPPAQFDDLLERIRSQLERAQPRLVSDPRLVLRAALLGYPHDEELARPRAAWEAQQRHEFAEHLHQMLTAVGRTPIDPLTTLDLATAIWLMADGLGLAASVDPSFSERRLQLDPARPPWTLLAYAARCIVVELTCPADHATAAHTPPCPDPPAHTSSVASWGPVERRALAAGAQIFAEGIGRSPTNPDDRPPLAALGHVTLARVARAAGVTRRQLYHLWDSQEAFRLDLVHHIGADQGALYYESFDEGIADVLAAPRLSHVALDICEHINQWRLDPDAEVQPSVRFTLHPHMRDDAVRSGALAWMSRLRGFQQQRIDAMVELFGARLRPGVETDDINSLLMVAAGGSERLHRVDPTAMRGGLDYRGGSYTIFSIMCQAFVDHSVVSAERPTP